MDFLLQTKYQYSNKGTYGHPGGIIHAQLHALASWMILFFLGYHANIIFWLALAEAVVHYHIDWAKVQITKNCGWSKFDTGDAYNPAHLRIFSNNYFHALGFDQLLHQLTYIAMAAYL